MKVTSEKLRAESYGCLMLSGLFTWLILMGVTPARAGTASSLLVSPGSHDCGAGTSVSHSQIVATPIPPMQMRRKYEVAISHYDDTGRCLYCDLVEAEMATKARVVLETERFVVFTPFASRAPFETWIAPKEQQSSFGQVSRQDLGALAQLLRKTLLPLYQTLRNPDFNYILHTAPIEDKTKY